MLDLRVPIGWYFVVNAVLLAFAGFFSGSLSIVPWNSERSINLNLCWALVLGGFGLLMLGLSYGKKLKAMKRTRNQKMTKSKLRTCKTLPINSQETSQIEALAKAEKQVLHI